jgi:DUF1365 family protein
MTAAEHFFSAVYTGKVRHRRHVDAAHQFDYALFMVYLDLDEIERVCAQSRWWSARGFAPAWFRRDDFLPGRPGSLRAAVLEALHEKGADATAVGPVRVLTHLRYWGLSFNPISIFYVFGKDGMTLRHLLLEVHNTPWNERHLYLLDADANATHDAGTAKGFHVSPFLPMDMQYRFRFNTPGERLSFHMDNFRNGERAFDVTLSLQREDITASSLNRALLRFPWMTARVLLGIYWQALLLMIKGVRFHAHPGRKP